jgi:GNAT superfamily N-acetyltransferase
MTIAPCLPGELHPVHPADVTDAEGVVSALADAFDGYPWTTWTVPEHDHARRLRGLFRATVSEIGLPFGEVWVSRCAATDEVAGAAVALRPDREVPAAVWRRVSSAEEELMGERTAAAHDAEAACQPLRPPAPHLVLATVGVRREHQRRGVATALLKELTRLADVLGVPAYLETSTASNVAFYQRSGFAVSGCVQVPDGGPTVWAMRRAPAAGLG